MLLVDRLATPHDVPAFDSPTPSAASLDAEILDSDNPFEASRYTYSTSNNIPFAPAKLNNLTKRAAGTMPPVVITVGHGRQHVGIYKGQQLYDLIHACLKWLCPAGNSGHYFCRLEVCNIEHVMDVASEMEFTWDKKVMIHVRASYIPGGWDGMRDALVSF
jgi:hypothetical protein